MLKIYFKQFVLTVAMLLCNVVANAHDFEVDGIFYNFIQGTDNAVAVTYKGGNYAYYKNEYTGNVVIPDSVIYNGMSFRVTNIQGYAFYDCKELTGVTIPDGVLKIGEYAFHKCSGLTSITIPDNVIIIGERAFFDCTGLKNVDMGASVTYIEACAFDGCSSLTSIELPTSLISLEHQVFLSCSSLTNIVIPDNVISIGFNTFGSCTNLKSITLSNSITSIGNAMFLECKSLANITIPNSVTTIGVNAFYGCTALTSITIPSSVKDIGVGAFSYCPKLASINVGHSNSRYDSRENCNAIIETRTNTLIAGCNNSIIPDNVICIGESAFCGSGLTHLVIPKSVTNIMDYAFSSCSELSSIIVERDNSRYDSRENCNAIIETKTNTLIAGCNNSIIPNDIRSIGKAAFSGRTGLTNIAIPENVASIGRYAFSGCTSLADVTIGNGVASIEESAFRICPLKTLKCESKIPATLGKDVFSEIDLTSTVLKVPAGSKDVYSNTDGWNDFWNIEEFYYDRYFYVNYIVDDLLFARDSIKHGAEVILIEAPTKEGHTFSGWNEAPSTMPAEDIIIRGSFTANQYEVTYIVDGEIYASDSIAYGTALEPLAEPTKEGHTFCGWSEIPATMPAENITITGSFAVNSYLLTYVVDGEIYASDSIAYGTALESLAEPTKEGHTFCGWSEIPATMPAKDIVIEGTFSINSYAIIYKVDGEVYATDSVVYGGEISLRDEPVKEGHTFSGWNESPVTMPAKDVVIEGSFTVNSYKVTYVIGEEKVYEEEIAYGDTIVPPTKFEKEGYKLTWNNLPVTMPAKDIVVEGSYSLNKYLVTYLVDGEVYATDSVEYGAPLTIPDDPTKEGHSFVEWEGLPESMPANDITVNAKFSINSYKVTYIVDGETFAIDSVAYATKIQLRDEPVKEGYTFSGWSEAPETMPANDITIEGTFTVNSYKVTYIVDGEVYATDSITYCSEIVLRDEPTKEGHTFSGWSEAPATMPANDITIEGTFSVNVYSIIYIIDNEVYAADNVEFGSEINLREEPTKDGYTFSGWKCEYTIMPAMDIFVYGTFSVNYYSITYIVDSETYAIDSVAYGTEIDLRDEPVKEGHTFSGWSEAPETMPANDITIEGTFSINSYTVTFIIDGEVYETATVEFGAEIELPTPPEKEGYIFSGWVGVPDTMPAEDIVIEGEYIVDTTGINDMKAENGKVKGVYDLQGRKVDNATNGIYIINGKKTLIK